MRLVGYLKRIKKGIKYVSAASAGIINVIVGYDWLRSLFFVCTFYFVEHYSLQPYTVISFIRHATSPSLIFLVFYWYCLSSGLPSTKTKTEIQIFLS